MEPQSYPVFNFGPLPSAPNKRVLRPYQIECVDRALAALQTHQRIIAVLATGLGKSVIFAEIARRFDGRVLLLSHRLELVRQGRNHLFDAAGGEWCGIEQGTLRGGDARLVSASVQTMAKRYSTYSPDHFGLVIIDEAHHAPAQSYRKILKHFSAAKLLGVTATPDRADRKGLHAVFEKCCYRMDIGPAVDEGWLVPLKGQRRYIKDIQLAHIKKTCGDLQEGQLDNAIVNAAVAISRDLAAELPNRRILVFTPGVASGKLIASSLNEIIPGCARSVDGKTGEDERREAFDKFGKGHIQFLVNCQLVTEGVDIPACDTIAMCRPTLSRGLYTQMIGRGLRALPGTVDGYDNPEARHFAIEHSGKPSCLIVDYVGNSGKHDLIGPVDILGSKETPEVIAAAKKVIKKASERGESIDVEAAISLAKEGLAKLAGRRVTATVKSRAFDPLAAMHLPRDPDMNARREPPSEKQLAFLRKSGFEDKELHPLSKMECTRVIADVMTRRNQGLATIKQYKTILKYVVDPSDPQWLNLTFDAASKMISRIAAKQGWGERRQPLAGGM